MIHHIVLFRFKPETSDQAVLSLADALASLKDKIPGIINYSWSASVSPEHLERGYTHGFVMTFQNEQYRDEYLPHPAHKEVSSRYVDLLCEQVLVFDIATQEK